MGRYAQSISKSIILFFQLYLSGERWTYLADLNKQEQNRLELILGPMKGIEDVTEDLKQHDQMVWVRMMNNIRKRVEGLVNDERIYNGMMDVS